jgi:nitroreductase/NAD-dependent dihydropyrimidine dehydrogenase PreA subunit
MSLITVNRELCSKDGLCVGECPLGLIVAGREGIIEEVERAAEFCLACGHCIAVCPRGALSLSGVKAEELSPVIEKDIIKAADLIHFMKSRRSIRSYKTTPVARESLEKLIDAARWAPTAKNAQPVQWLVLESREEVRKLAALVIEGLRRSGSMPGMVEAFEKGKDVVFRGAPHIIMTHAPAEGFIPYVDCTIALTYLELAAAAEGIGACWAGFLMLSAANNPAVEAHLGIPKGRRVFGALMIGYPRHGYARVPARKKAVIAWR